ncbi:MAG: GNAT family N-acetyltransferase [Devosiaceae bacterium]|nr:GNAT family N-acetyltransferase [Devosiaceae bacterium]
MIVENVERDDFDGTEQVDGSGEASANVNKTSKPLGILTHQVKTQEDVVRLIGLATEAHAESRFSHLEFSEEKYFRAYSSVIGSDNKVAFFVCYNGRPVGVTGATVGEHFLGNGGRMATAFTVYVSEEIRRTFLGGKVAVRLVRLLADWANIQNADELHIMSTAGIVPQRTDKFFKKLGFVTYGGNYVARVG